MKHEGSKKRKVSFIEEARKKQIVEIAIELIAQNGYQQTTLAEIADRAGISKGVIPYYFKNKQSLIFETRMFISKSLHEYVDPRVEMEHKSIDKLRTFVKANYEYMKFNRLHMVAMVDLWGSHKTQNEKMEMYKREYEQDRKMLSRIIQNGLDSGEIPDCNPITLSNLILALVDGIMIQWVFNAPTVDLDDNCRQAIQMLNKYVGVTS